MEIKFYRSALNMIKNAQIHFNEMGTPVADNFDDVYFSNDDGLAESHYVFFTQNNIAERLQNHDQPHFTIAETGFGTGLNFLNVWHHFKQRPVGSTVQKLHFISFEKYPIKQNELIKALATWPSLKAQASALCQQYPIALAGCHRLEFENGQVILDLWFGDVHQSLPQISYQSQGIVDAWFLDGFAPSKNPDMWQQSLFNAMADLSRDQATFATFTAAGFVRRGLQEAGFSCKKVKGYGRKREMIVGQLSAANPNETTPAFYHNDPRALSSIAIIGGGVASSCLQFHLAKRGKAVSLFCQDNALAKGASHNRQGAVYPHLQADHAPPSELYAHAYLYAKRFYQHIDSLGFHFDHDWCGVLLQACNEAKIAQQQNLVAKNNWPAALIKAVSQNEASEIAGVHLPYGGLFIDSAGWVDPVGLTHAIHDAAQQIIASQTHFDTDIDRLEKTASGWYLYAQDEKFGPFSDVFVCGGEQTDRFEQTKNINLHGVRGQVSHIAQGQESSQLKTVLCHKGYFTPSLKGEHAMGATFDKHTKSRAVKMEDNLLNHAQLMKFYSKSDFALSLGDINSAKAAVRCCFNDHMPMLGQVPEQSDLCHAYKNLSKGKSYDFELPSMPYEGLHVITGFGARGLCSAPLTTEHLVASLFNEPRPLSERTHQIIHPNRFTIRDIIRNKIT